MKKNLFHLNLCFINWIQHSSHAESCTRKVPFFSRSKHGSGPLGTFPGKDMLKEKSLQCQCLPPKDNPVRIACIILLLQGVMLFHRLGPVGTFPLNYVLEEHLCRANDQLLLDRNSTTLFGLISNLYLAHDVSNHERIDQQSSSSCSARRPPEQGRTQILLIPRTRKNFYSERTSTRVKIQPGRKAA